MNAHQSITDSVLTEMVLLPLLRDTLATQSKFIDSRDYDFVDFMLLHGASDDETVDMKVQESVNADGSAASDVTDAAITQIAAAGDNVLCVISVRKETLTKRYVGVLVTQGAGTNGSNDAVLAQAYRKAGNLPVTQAAAGANHYGTTQVVKV